MSVLSRTRLVPVLALVIAAAASVPGCTPNSATQVLSDTSYDIAMAERFGRMDIVVDQVAPSKRDAFIRAHAHWGGNIRIVDLEYAGMRLNDQAHADVTLIIAWQRLDDSSLRTTTLKQSWFHGEDHWVITKEARASGDHGLLEEPDPEGDAKPASARSAERTSKHSAKQSDTSPSVSPDANLFSDKLGAD